MKSVKPYLIGALVMLGVLVMATTVFASPPAATGCFTDTNGHWAETFVCWMEQMGIVGGYPDGTFRPENRVTRAEASVMLQNASSLTRAAGKHFYGCGSMCFGPAGAVAPGATEDFGSVTIEAPGPGYLVINGVLELDCQGGVILPGSCAASFGNTFIVDNGNQHNSMYYSVDGGVDDSAAGTKKTAAHATMIQVGGGTHTVALRVINNGGSAGYTNVWSGGINVIFVGFNGDGVAP